MPRVKLPWRVPCRLGLAGAAALAVAGVAPPGMTGAPKPDGGGPVAPRNRTYQTANAPATTATMRMAKQQGLDPRQAVLAPITGAESVRTGSAPAGVDRHRLVGRVVGLGHGVLLSGAVRRTPGVAGTQDVLRTI